ncbi:hypothetical protein QAD02_005602 [Eretmocerus hayati]|uniref:Uncharacterized protein n=1 Tax=Eretmocerus hayati TaxID=131215 RepID=A0ACC2NXS6_9HYME|nr:hypothetical protein QAD02_005602 [Eretmocerus hayati]
MAAACYERKVGEPGQTQLTTILPADFEQQLAGTPSPATASPTSMSPLALGVPFRASERGPMSLPQPKTPFKDYSQTLHVDCSVEYELPSAAKPPPGNGEPLLMIHPCYYRRAERERQIHFRSEVSAATTATATPSEHDGLVGESDDAGCSGGSLDAAASLALQAGHPEAKQQHPKLQSSAGSVLQGNAVTASELDEKLLASLYPQYFRGLHKQQRQTPQQTAMQPVIQAQLQQAQTQPQVLRQQQPQQIMVGSTAALLHPAYPSQGQQQQQAPHHHAIHALHAAHGAFYEAPVYHALLPQS